MLVEGSTPLTSTTLLLPYIVYVSSMVGTNCCCETEVYPVESPKMLQV